MIFILKISIDTCSGDSGGPLMQMANTETGPKQFLVGLVSYGPSPCGKTPAIYTNITYYIPFIFDKMISSSQKTQINGDALQTVH